MIKSSNEKRRLKFIDRKVQGELAMRTLLHWITLMTIATIVSICLQCILNPLEPFMQNVARAWNGQGPFILVAICLFPLFARDTIQFSHRFVGPIARFRSTVRELTMTHDKLAPPIGLRPNDYWTEFAAELNELISEVNRLRKQTGEIADGDTDDTKSNVGSPAESEVAVIAG